MVHKFFFVMTFNFVLKINFVTFYNVDLTILLQLKQIDWYVKNCEQYNITQYNYDCTDH